MFHFYQGLLAVEKKKKTLDKYFKIGQNSDANYAQLKYLEGYYKKKKKRST